MIVRKKGTNQEKKEIKITSVSHSQHRIYVCMLTPIFMTSRYNLIHGTNKKKRDLNILHLLSEGRKNEKERNMEKEQERKYLTQ